MSVKLDDSRARAPFLVDPAWQTTGSMSQSRAIHTLVTLPSGAAHAVGGYGAGGTFLDSSELFDPASGTWAATGSLAAPRVLHTSVVLPDGTELAVGGTMGLTAIAEFYDEAYGTWSSGPQPSTQRCAHTATVLPSGNVLVAGGSTSSGCGISSTTTSTET